VRAAPRPTIRFTQDLSPAILWDPSGGAFGSAMSGNVIGQNGPETTPSQGELRAAWVALPYTSGSAPAPVTDEGALAAPRGLNAHNIVDIIQGLRPEVERILVEAYEPECRRYTWDAQYERYKECILFASVCGDASRILENLAQQRGLSAEVRFRGAVSKDLAVACNLHERHPFWDDGHAVTFIRGEDEGSQYLVDASAWQYLLNISRAQRNFYNDLILDHRAFSFSQRLSELGQSDRRIIAVNISNEEARRSSVREIATWYAETFAPWLETTVAQWSEPQTAATSGPHYFRYRPGSFPTRDEIEAHLLALWDPVHYRLPSDPSYRGLPRFMSIAEMRAEPDAPELMSITNRRLARVMGVAPQS
jgi:hypothetical protein